MSVLHRRRFLSVAAAAAAGAALPRPAISQAAFPSKPLRLIVPAPAGSRHGLSARLFAESLSRAAGQPVEIDNPDNSPAMSYGLIAGSASDGHTLGFATVDLAILHWRGLTDLKPGDFTPIAILNKDPAGIHVRADSPWQTARELTDYVKANPGKLKASSTAAGGIWHLSTVSWLGAAGVPVEALPWVPAPGPAAGVEDMMLGGADIIVCSTPEVRITPQASQTRTLAIMSSVRLPRFGNIPTLQEALGMPLQQAPGKLRQQAPGKPRQQALGMPLQQAPGTPLTAGAWRGLIAPKGISAGSAASLAALAKTAWEDKAFQEQMQRRGYLLTFAGAGEAGRYMDDSSSKLGAALKAAGIVKV